MILAEEHSGRLCRDERRYPEVGRTPELRVTYGLAFGKAPQRKDKNRYPVDKLGFQGATTLGETQYPRLDFFSTFLMYDSTWRARDSLVFLQEGTEQWMYVTRARGAYGAWPVPSCPDDRQFLDLFHMKGLPKLWILLLSGKR